MRLQIASDLHHEMSRHRAGLCGPLPSAPGAEGLVLAGDIHEGTAAVDLYGGYPLPVIYVHGNHEPIHQRYPRLVCELEGNAYGTSVRFVKTDEYVIGDVRLMGACVRTDHLLHPFRFRDSLDLARLKVIDYKRIRLCDSNHFQPEDALRHQHETLLWLRERLDAPYPGKTVVVTHHLTSELSIPLAHRQHAFAPAYASNIELLALRADVWVHGHIHSSCDYRIGDCRVLCNTRGRPGRNRTHPDIPYENAAFNPTLVIDV